MMKPTPTKNRLPLRKGSFTTLAEALDYAAEGETGFNFYNGVGKLSAVLPYKNLQKEAKSLARRLLGYHYAPGKAGASRCILEISQLVCTGRFEFNLFFG